MQRVEIYYGMDEARSAMEKHINWGWRIHTCTMGCYVAGYTSKEKVMVIYEKNDK